MRKARIREVRCPWMNSRLSQAMNQRDHLHRRAIKSNSPYLWPRYKKLKNYVNREMQKCKAEYYSNLISILLNMDPGRLTGAVFLDLSKAFDTVDHNILLHKFKSVRLSDDTVIWFQSYLANRKQRTSVGDTLSVAAPITVGVPQGSILGPLLFLIYVNDLPSCQLASEIILYADATVIYYSSTDMLDLESKLNSDLDTISDWFSSNLLTLNISKCNFVIFGNSRKLKLVNDVSLKVNSTAIDRCDSFKYLGVVINQTMSWSEHIDSISTKINQRIGMAKRIRHLLPLRAKLTLYNCLIIPLFEYGDTVWVTKITTHLWVS